MSAGNQGKFEKTINLMVLAISEKEFHLVYHLSILVSLGGGKSSSGKPFDGDSGPVVIIIIIIIYNAWNTLGHFRGSPWQLKVSFGVVAEACISVVMDWIEVGVHRGIRHIKIIESSSL